MIFTDQQLRELDPLDVLRELGGYYKCPKAPDGRRLGPLVGYAGRYEASDGTMMQFVGDEYANFAFAEEWTYILDAWAQRVSLEAGKFDVQTGLAMPIGGIQWNASLGRRLGWRSIKADKEVISVKTKTDRERSALVMGRHKIHPSEPVAMVEDVCNNFATTREAYELVENYGGVVLVIVCLLNRSGKIVWVAPDGREIPIVAVVTREIPEYKQDDPFVVKDVVADNLVRKPKDQWHLLEEAMDRARGK